MEWILDIQLGRRNLPSAQRLAVMDKFKKKIQEQAANKKSKDIADSNKRRSSNVLQMEKNEDKPKIIHTDKEIARMAGVSEKTYHMEAKVLNSNNEDIKQRVMSGETSISAGYKEPV